MTRSMTDVQTQTRLLARPGFRRLLESRLFGQTASNAMVYAVLILVVEEHGSSLDAMLLVAALSLPSILLGIPGGTIADFLPRRLTMTLGYLARAIVAAALAYYSGNLGYIYLLVAAHSVVGQVFGPAEAGALPALVEREQLPAANAVMTLGLMLAQIAGMVVMAPILIKLISADAVFVVCAALFVVSAFVVGWFGRGFTANRTARRGMGLVAATKEGLRILGSDRRAYLAVAYLVIATALSKALVILTPEYTRGVLGIQPEDAVFVAAPAAIGAGVGLLVVAPLSRLFGAWRVVAFGFFTFVLGLIGLGLVVYVRDFLVDNLDFGIGFVEDEVGVSSVITVAMLLAIPLGFSFTLTSVAARVVMNEQAPQEAQGRVFAVQMALGDVLSLAPLIAIGVTADLLGVRATLLAAALAAMVASLYLTIGRRMGRGTRGRDPGAPGPQAESPG